jgi:hypothetical protein
VRRRRERERGGGRDEERGGGVSGRGARGLGFEREEEVEPRPRGGERREGGTGWAEREGVARSSRGGMVVQAEDGRPNFFLHLFLFSSRDY